MKCTFKVSIVGCGNVGATAAYAILLDGTPTHLTLIDIALEKSRGVVTDLEHALSFTEYTSLQASDDLSDCAGSNLIFVTAGARQKEGQTRLDLIQTNRGIFQEIIPKIAKAAPESLIVIVSNPVDVLTYEAIQVAGFAPGRVFGSGTMLDTARFRFHIGQEWGVNPKSVEAYILGEHGDSSFPVYSRAEVAGKRLVDFEGKTPADLEKCYETTREAAYNIIHDIGFTSYSIGTVMREIMKHVFDDSKIVVPLSTTVDQAYGIEDVCLSVPCVLGSNGIERIIKTPLTEDEMAQLHKSAEILKGYLSGE